MSSLYRLRAITRPHNLSPHRSLTRLSLTQPHPFRPSPISPAQTNLSPPQQSYSTTTTSPENTQPQHQHRQQNNHHDQNQQSQNEPTPPFPPLHPLRLLLSYLKLLALAHLIWNNLLSLAPAQGPSMLATYPITGTWHLTSRLSRLGRNLSIGDIVTFTLPDRPSAIGVKRVIGLPGDYVLIGTPGPAADDALMLQVSPNPFNSNRPPHPLFSYFSPSHIPQTCPLNHNIDIILVEYNLPTQTTGPRRPRLPSRRQPPSLKRLPHLRPRPPRPHKRQGHRLNGTLLHKRPFCQFRVGQEPNEKD